MDDYQSSQAAAKPGKRNLWFKDKFVTASDFSLEQGYMIERRRMLTRAVAGWGMVYGMELSLHSAGRGTQLQVSQGLALDRHGRELFLPHAVSVAANELILLGQLQQLAQRAADLPCGQTAQAQAQAKGQAQVQEQGRDEKKGEYRGLALLCAHYGERELDLVRSNRSCECGDNQYNHVQEVVQFSLAPLHECEGLPWGLDPCGECDCQPPYGSVAVPDQPPKEQQHLQQDVQKHLQPAVLQTAPHDRGPHDRLAACLAQHYIADEGAALCMVNGIATALHDPLPLAVVAVHINHCGQAEIEGIIDANHPRKLVKNNELLFDLVRGCDLTRIGNISWAAWHRRATPIPLHKFIQMFSPGAAAHDAAHDDPKSDQQSQAEAKPDAQQEAAKEQAPQHDAADKSAQAVADAAEKDAEQKPETPPASSIWGAAHDTSFAFEFTGPVQIATLTPEVVQIIVYVPDGPSGWLRPWLVPINGLRPHPPHKCDPAGTTRSAVVQVSAAWVSDELNSRNRLLRWETSRVEIHIRGDLILDARGQAVDADALGMRATPSGNGTPGGTFVSVFSIAPDGKAEEPR